MGGLSITGDGEKFWTKKEIFGEYNIFDAAIVLSTLFCFIVISLLQSYGVVTVVSHVLYIPIILFAYRYPAKGILFAAIISVSYLISFDILINPMPGLYLDAAGRTVVFILVGGVVSYISKQLILQKGRYLDLFNNLSYSIFVSETDEDKMPGNIAECNNIACESLGYKKDELLLKSVSELVAEDDREKLNLSDHYYGYYSPSESEVLMIKKDGTHVPFELKIHTYEANGKTLHITVAHNIQKRIEAEKKALDYRWKLEESQNIAHLGCWEADPRTEVEVWSNETFRIFGMKPSADMKVDFTDYSGYMHPDYRERVFEEYERSRREKKELSVRYKIIRGDGEERWIYTRCRHYTGENGQIVRTLGVDVDITKDMEAESKITEQAKFFETLLETIPLPVFYKNIEGRYLGCNQAYANLAGKRKEFIIGKTVAEIFDEKTALAQSERDNLLQKMSGIQIYEAEIPSRRNSPRSLIVSKAVIKDKKGEPNFIIGVMQDITDIKKTKEYLKKSLDEKNILLQEVHHRVKNNLAAISGILSIEKSRIKDKDALNFLNEAESRIQSMVIVHESLYHSGNLGDMDAEEHFRNLFESVLISYSPPAEVILDIDTKGCRIDINSAIPCSLVVNEILTNSMKYAFEGRQKGVIGIRMECIGDMYRLSVSDDGCGIPKNFVPDTSPTLGMKVISNIVKLQLMGKVALSRDKGTKWTIEWKKKDNNI